MSNRKDDPFVVWGRTWAGELKERTGLEASAEEIARAYRRAFLTLRFPNGGISFLALKIGRHGQVRPIMKPEDFSALEDAIQGLRHENARRLQLETLRR